MATHSDSEGMRAQMEREAPFIKHIPMFIEGEGGVHTLNPEAKAAIKAARNLSDAELAEIEPTAEEIGDTFLIVDRADGTILCLMQYEQMPEHVAGACPVCDETPERGN
jgi:hypothetical protein